jgi:translation elongation factor EF-1beta
VGFGINRLRIGCIIKDDEVDWEDVRDLMLANRNLVQSVDLYGIHKSKIVNE